MGLTPTLGSTLALYRKLERELYRVHHQRNRINKADHFYNFCVTAHSLRDYFFHEKEISSESMQEEYHESWNRDPVLVAVKEIANSSKHFALRKAPKTKRVRSGKNDFVDIYVNDQGEILTRVVAVPDYFVTLPDGSRHELYVFMDVVLLIWRQFLKVNGYQVRRQSFEQLHG